MLYEVERIRDGRSFATRRVVAIQQGQAIFSLDVSFQVAEKGFEHAHPMPNVPPLPKLQAKPEEGLARLRAEEERELTSYGWENRDQGVVRVPIERAIELISARGLPARKLGPPAVEPVSEPNEAGLGRVLYAAALAPAGVAAMLRW